MFECDEHPIKHTAVRRLLLRQSSQCVVSRLYLKTDHAVPNDRNVNPSTLLWERELVDHAMLTGRVIHLSDVACEVFSELVFAHALS